MQRRSASTWAEYGALFAGATDAHRAIGEASPAYFVCPEVAARIRARFPAAKLVAILRQPVEQALSLHLVRQGGSASGAGLIEGFVAALAATARASRAGRAVSRSPSTGSITGISRRAVSSQPGRPRPRCPGRAAGTQDGPRA